MHSKTQARATKDRAISIKAKMLFTVLVAIAMFVFVPTALAGPVVLMGIDAEDGGVGGHGPISVYDSVVNDIYANATNGGAGILVIGGGKNPGDDVTEFWDQIGTDTGKAITYVNGPTDITGAVFTGKAMIAVVSSVHETGGGGLEDDENGALASRQSDVAAFVNSGGGVLGFSQGDFLPGTEYAYLGGLGAFSFNFQSYSDITPTADGLAIGITNALDICCWHDEYLTFPSFLKVLAVNAEDEVLLYKHVPGEPNHAAAIGGKTVYIDSTPPNSTSSVGSCTPDGVVSFTVTDDPQGSGPGSVLFKIDGGADQSVATDANGNATIVLDNGVHTVESWGADKAGNQEVVRHTVSTTVDTTNRCAPPPVVIIADSAGPSVKVASLSARCVKKTMKIVADASDNGGIRDVVFSIDGRVVKTDNWPVYSTNAKVKSLRSGKHTVKIVATDTAGNATTVTRRFTRCARPAKTIRRISPRFTG